MDAPRADTSHATADAPRATADAPRAVTPTYATDRYRFSHGLVAETLDDTPDALRLHGRLADALERREGDDAAAAIAHHRLAIAHVDDAAAEAAANAAERAARVALAQLAFEDAAALLDRALGVLPDRPATRKQRASLMCARAEALQHAGEHAIARALCDRAAELARGAGAPPPNSSKSHSGSEAGTRDSRSRIDPPGSSKSHSGSETGTRDSRSRIDPPSGIDSRDRIDLPDGVLLARIALARGIEFSFGATDDVLVDALREALDTMPPGDSGLRARCLARLAAAEQPAIDPRVPVATAREAIAMARRIGDRRTRLEVLHVAFAALIEFVPPVELDVLLRELFVLATGPGDRLIALRNRLRHCFITLELGDRAAFDVAVGVHAELAESVGIARWLWPARLMEALVALFEGRFDAARVAADNAEELAAGDPQRERTFAYHRWAAAWTQTLPSAALARQVGDRWSYVRPFLTVMAALDEGDPDALRAALAAASDGATLAHDDVATAQMVDGIAAAGDRARARGAYDQLAPTSGRVWVASMTGFAVVDLADRGLLVLAATLEEWDAVDRHGKAAVELARKLDAAPWLARVHADWAAALDRRGETARADELWTSARTDAERLDMPGLLARCRAARPGRRPSVRMSTPAIEPIATDEPVSVAREGELWVVRGRGCVARVRDSRGVQMLAQLVAAPNREIHALELAGDGGGIDTGDAGEHLDAKAKAAYRKRLAELTEEVEEAEAWRDAARAERARGEIDALARELQRAVGLGGRDRKAGAASERARSNVQRRIAYAIQQITHAAPALGQHLATTVRTGVFCVYSEGG